MPKEKHIGILTQKEIDDLLASISSGEESKQCLFEDAETLECVEANFSRVKTSKELFQLILDFVKERHHYRDTIRILNEEKDEYLEDMKMIKRIISKITL